MSWSLEENELARALARKRARGEAILDLTVANPTRVGLEYPGREILGCLSSERALTYEPSARGPLEAREAVARYYEDRSRVVAPDDLFLTASTSEAYGFLFKLLCDPGDEVLVPEPSYPLFDFLAALDSVRPRPYPLRFDGSWHVDFDAVASCLSERTRAIVAVHPNNPTGSYVAGDDRERLLALAEGEEVALIVDEVFLDFPLRPPRREAGESFAGERRGLVFVLSGLSKLAALPQMKLAWIAVSGERQAASEAALRLEHIADTYLSVSAPVALAAPRLLELAPKTASLVSVRTRQNLDVLLEASRKYPPVSLVPLHGPEGGWSAVLRLPAIQKSEQWALEVLESASVYVHPGSFFSFATEAVLVVSLLAPKESFREGTERLFRLVSDRLN